LRNLDMVFHGLQAVLTPMKAAGQGQVVVFTSSTGARPDPITSIYGGTRAGANGIVRAVGLEMARDGIQVNAVGTNFMDFPGFIKATGADDPERRAKIEAQTPPRHNRGVGARDRSPPRRKEPLPDRTVLRLLWRLGRVTARVAKGA
jgi:NAD(P)-dependent dehydrogenase (short-subunit alcohol dehydrogenase family)